MLFLDSDLLVSIQNDIQLDRNINLTESSILKTLSNGVSAIKQTGNETGEKVGISSVTWDKAIERYELRIKQSDTLAEKNNIISDINTEIKLSDDVIAKADQKIALYEDYPEQVKKLKQAKSNTIRYKSQLNTLLRKTKAIVVSNK